MERRFLCVATFGNIEALRTKKHLWAGELISGFVIERVLCFGRLSKTRKEPAICLKDKESRLTYLGAESMFAWVLKLNNESPENM